MRSFPSSPNTSCQMPLSSSYSILNWVMVDSRSETVMLTPRRRETAMSVRIALFFIASLFVACARAAEPVDASWLVAELRKGGYLVFFRHTTTFRDSATMEMEARNVSSGRLSLDDC